MIVGVLALLSHLTPTFIVYQDGGFVILEQGITIDTIPLCLHELIDPHDQTKRISNPH